MTFFIVGAGLIVVGVLTFWRQSRATGCPKHSHMAGRVAVILAWACLLAGGGLLGFHVRRGQDTNRLSSAVATGFKNWLGIKEPPAYTPPSLPQAEAEQVVDRLIGMGYLKFVPESKRPDVRRQLIEAAGKRYLDADWNDNGVSADQRGYPADNEDLAEGNVGATILLMKPVLEREGVKLDSVVDEFGDERYAVAINGQSHLIYEGDAVANSWALALKRLLEITNGLLEEAGSSERLYFSYSGNDGRVMLLTEEMQDYIESIGDVMDYKWMPRRVEQIKVGGPK